MFTSCYERNLITHLLHVQNIYGCIIPSNQNVRHTAAPPPCGAHVWLPSLHSTYALQSAGSGGCLHGKWTYIWLSCLSWSLNRWNPLRRDSEWGDGSCLLLLWFSCRVNKAEWMGRERWVISCVPAAYLCVPLSVCWTSAPLKALVTTGILQQLPSRPHAVSHMARNNSLSYGPAPDLLCSSAALHGSFCHLNYLKLKNNTFILNKIKYSTVH